MDRVDVQRFLNVVGGLKEIPAHLSLGAESV